MKKSLLIKSMACLMFLSGFSVYGQQNAQFSHFMFNPMFYNPGYAGMDGAARFSALHRSQWLGYQPSVSGDVSGQPETQLITFNMPLLKINSGFGVNIIHDQVGPLRQTLAQASYSYHANVGGGKLGIGVRAGVFNLGTRAGYRVVNEDDAVYQALNQTQNDLKPDFAAGVWYKHTKWFGGFGVYHLVPQRFDFGNDILDNTQVRHYYVTAGYNYEVNYNFVLTPSVLYKAGDFNASGNSFDVNLMATIENKYWGGLSYRQQDAVTLIAGLSLLKDNSLKVSYAFDLTVPSSEAKRPTSHEIMLAYVIPVELKGSKPIIRTPRYRK
jgi:type IX secretion system PorP/SprF family membrane protein